MHQNIQTKRLHIRPIQLEDAAFIYSLVNSEGWLKFIGKSQVNNEFDAEKYIQKIIDNPDYYYSVIELTSTQQAIGIITFLKRGQHSYPDFGFALLPQFEKQGFAYEASEAYLKEIVKQALSPKILGITLTENTASILLLERLGFKFENNIVEYDEQLSIYSLSANN